VVPAGARFCAQCGAAVGERVPANVMRVEPRYFGIPPATLLLAIAAAALIAGIALVMASSVLAGTLLAAASLPLFAAFLTLARRFPDSALARRVIHAVDGAAWRAGYLGGLVSVRARTRRRLLQERRELGVLEGRRSELLSALGAAVYADAEGAAASLRDELRELDETRARKEAEMQVIATQAEERIRQARFEAEPTQAIEAPEPVVPEPAQVPEPYPPGELTPPEPPAIPEPYPPPDEGSPPVPPVVPEPYPPGESRRQ
jgi:hypothetical protein